MSPGHRPGPAGEGSALTEVADGEGRLAVEVRGRPAGGADPVTVALQGEVDPHTAPVLQEALDRQIVAGATTLRIDCEGLLFIDSSGLRVLVDAHRRLGADRSDALVLASVSPTLRRLLEVTGLDTHLTVEPAS